MVTYAPMAMDLTSALRDALMDFLEPLEEASKDPAALAAWLEQLGHTAVISGSPEVAGIFVQAGALRSTIANLDPGSLSTLAGLSNLLHIAQAIGKLQQDLSTFANDPANASIAGKLGEEVVSLLLANYLRRNHMPLFRVSTVFTLIDSAETAHGDPAIVQDGVTVRYPAFRDEFNFANVGPLFSDPGPLLKQFYFPNDLALGADAWLAGSRLFENLGYLANAIGLSWRIVYQPSVPPPPPAPDTGDDSTVDASPDPNGWDNDPEDDDSGDDQTEDGPGDTDDGTDDEDSGSAILDAEPPLPDSYYSAFFPSFRVVLLSSTTDPGTEVALEVQCSSSSHPGATPGYIVSVVGTLNSVNTFGLWKLTLTATGQVPAFVLQPTGFNLVPAAVPLAGGAAKILLERLPPTGSTGPVFVLGSTNGTRLEIGATSLEADFSYDPAHIAAGVAAKASKCSFVIHPGDGDSFLSSVLPANGLQADFDLGLGYSSDGGLTFQGAAGLDATLPIGLSLGGVITIPSLHLGLTANIAGLQAQVSATVGASIGPVQALVDRVGVLVGLTFPSGGGNFGPADFSFTFKPPSGVGLAINSGGVSGGGVLSFLPAQHQYSGVLQLQFNDLALQAFGLITTQVAGGSGYSLLALVDANFPPVQLGWGFTLNGVGGLLAVHRSADTDKLRAALKADKLSSVLFPKSAISNAPPVLSQLDALFPAAAGRFLFGPLALIGWGTPNVLTIALAVILEVPEPVRILLLARMAMRLPSDSNPLVRVNMDALGVLDLSQSTFALDAVLFDSKLMGYTLSGGMALRANWSSKREFVLAIGGFHPQFTPPVGFPTLDRIAIDMPSSSIAKMRLAAYLAITSNSVQFGASLDVVIGGSGFKLTGHLGFDALLQIEPFYFTADVSASIALSVGGDDLMSVGLDATLSGPAPWNIAGKFKIHLFFVTLHKHFSYTWGADTPSQPILPVVVLTLVQDALKDARNWGTSLPPTAPALASIRSRDAGTPVVHPLSQIEVHQRVAPLGLAITRFGSSPIDGANLFTIDYLLVNGNSVLSNSAAIQDDFAPAQFFDLSDQDKLSGPSFEPYDAGVRYAPKAVRCGPSMFKTVAYETSYIDKPGVIRPPDLVPPHGWFFTLDLQFVLATGASGKATVWKAGNRRFGAPGSPFFVAPQKFTVASTTTLLATSASANGLSWSAARAVMKQAIADDPSLAIQLQVIATHELAGA